jgi:PAS domain S-box-containing protein
MPDAIATTDRLPDEPVKLLLVDDLPANLLALGALLDGAGYHLVEARSGEEALRRLHDEEFAVVLLDVHMPGLDGFETARRVRAQESVRHTPIIFISAYESDDFPVAEAYKLGAVDYLTKPLVPEIVRAKVAGLVELHEQARLARRQSELVRLLIEGIRDYAVYLLDPQGYVLTWNPGAERIKGYTAAEIIGRHFSCFYPPEDIAAGKPARELEVARTQGKYAEEGWRLRGDGTRFWASVVVAAMRDESGKLRGFSKVTRDMSDRKLAEENARRLLQEQAARRAAEEADRLKDQFLAMLAHELRNPLAPIRNALHIMRQPGANGAVVGRAQDMAERQVQHMARLLEDLLDVSRISQGRIELRKETVDVAELVNRTVEAVHPLVETRRHELTVTLPPEPLRVDADPTRLEQIITNLLTNACKYTDPGGKIWLSAEREGDHAVLRVRDNGIGVRPDMLPRIFDLFVQAERRLDRAQGGVGIGLTLVRRLVEMHGGTVHAASAGPGQGSEFLVRLPALDAAPAARGSGTAAPVTPPARRLPPRRVLVVDDNEDAANTMAMLLELEGHEVRAVHDGSAALEAARQMHPEVVLLDIGMPGMDGYEVARRLRQDPHQAGVLLVAVTGWGQEDDRRRSREAGFDEHLVKPSDLARLRELFTSLANRTQPPR